MKGGIDRTLLLQASHGPRRWRVSAVQLIVVLFLATGCRGTRPTLRDEGKSGAELRTMLADADPEVQARGALGLSRLGPEARDAVPELIPLLKSSTPLTRQNAALALAAVGLDAGAAIPALTEALKDPEWAIRRQAAIALGAIGPSAKPALATLKRLESDAQKPVREAAKQAREKIGEWSRYYFFFSLRLLREGGELLEEFASGRLNPGKTSPPWRLPVSAIAVISSEPV